MPLTATKTRASKFPQAQGQGSSPPLPEPPKRCSGLTGKAPPLCSSYKKVTAGEPCQPDSKWQGKRKHNADQKTAGGVPTDNRRPKRESLKNPTTSKQSSSSLSSPRSPCRGVGANWGRPSTGPLQGKPGRPGRSKQCGLAPGRQTPRVGGANFRAAPAAGRA